MKFKILNYQINLAICGGTIIGPETILTAAHCWEDVPKLHRNNRNYYVEAGVTEDGLGLHRQEVFIKSYKLHPNYIKRK